MLHSKPVGQRCSTKYGPVDGGQATFGLIGHVGAVTVESEGLDTCATWLMQRGVDKWQASGFLGMTMETLEKNYGHHHPDYQAEAANAF